MLAMMLSPLELLNFWLHATCCWLSTAIGSRMIPGTLNFIPKCDICLSAWCQVLENGMSLTLTNVLSSSMLFSLLPVVGDATNWEAFKWINCIQHSVLTTSTLLVMKPNTKSRFSILSHFLPFTAGSHYCWYYNLNALLELETWWVMISGDCQIIPRQWKNSYWLFAKFFLLWNAAYIQNALKRGNEHASTQVQHYSPFNSILFPFTES